MDFSPDLPFDETQAKQVAAPNRERQFHAGAALLFLALMFIGFQPFYLHGKGYIGREIEPPVKSLLIVHGIGMTLWMLLFVLQTMLIASGNRRLHMMLGQFGAVLTACMVILGLWVSVAVARITPPAVYISGLAPRSFVLVPLTIIGTFATFAAIGLWNRRRSEIHRPMMLLAALATMPAPISRMYFINVLYYGTFMEKHFGEFFGALVVGAVLVVMKWVWTRSFDRWFTIGYAWLLVTVMLIMRLATTAVWESIGTFLLR